MRRKFGKPGVATSGPEITEVTSAGFRLVLAGRKRFLSFQDFPWFERAPDWKIRLVEQVGDDHLHWPELDVDLSVESIDHPKRFPLLWRA